MKRALVFVPLFLAALLLPTAAHAGAGATASVSFVNAVTFDADNNFPLTVCLEGVSQVDDLATGATFGPVDIAPGDYDVSFVQGTDCTADGFVEDTITVDPDANITVMAWWSFDDRGISVFDNDTSCVPAGQARVTLRHGAAADDLAVSVTPEGGSAETIISSVTAGEEGSGDVAAGPYSSVDLNDAEFGDLVVALGPQTFAGGSAYVIYAYGGNDGDVGGNFGPVVANPCEVPPSSSTTSTAAVAAQATKPTFTG